VGAPELKLLEDSADNQTRWVQLRVPVTEGGRYRVGNFTFEGNTVVKSEALRPLFKLKTGQFYSEKRIRKGLEQAREVYGGGGYFEFTGYPDLRPRDLTPAAGAPAPQNGAPGGDEASQSGSTPTPDGGDQTTAQGEAAQRPKPGAQPIVDVVMRLQEGGQYFVNRITFVGNTTTRDNVIRREMRLYENGVFNTEALKFSVRRINQLGYFKNLEQEAVNVEKTPGVENQVDITLKVEEQNRNQLTFGAGVSQYEGFFGQLSFQTANFLGRGETLTLTAQSGSRTQNYQAAFTEPFLFDRPITGGIDLFKRDLQYIGQFTQKSAGGNLVFGFPLASFTRMFVNYSYERVKVTDINELYLESGILERNPFLKDALLINEGGARSISKIVPSVVYNTVDSPIFPNTGKRYSASIDLAGFGGNTSFIKPRLEGVWYFQHTRRTSVGMRSAFEYVRPAGDSLALPIFERLFLGGEYSIRGFDIRSVGPTDPESGLVVGGNKSLLFNGEYLITIAGPVRAVLFYDAGQVRDIGERYAWNQFKTSTGLEIRFFMPVINVPFRLISAWNPNREGVLDNSGQPTKKFTFRFAVGSTF
jgi:outer membrane protein insertion porin family